MALADFCVSKYKTHRRQPPPHVVLQGVGGTFNISTDDYLTSRTCSGQPDLAWGHSGVFNYTSYPKATFTRAAVWIEPHSTGGVLFGKVLCPHVTFRKGERAVVPVKQLHELCGAITFDNCGVYYDVLAGNGTELRRSKAPSCKPTAALKADGQSGAPSLAVCHTSLFLTSVSFV